MGDLPLNFMEATQPHIQRAIELVRKYDAVQQEINDFLDKNNPGASHYHPPGTVELRLWIADETLKQN